MPASDKPKSPLTCLQNRRFRMIVFDWDGTAVPNRQAPIGRLKDKTERLLGEGILFVVITGTNLDNIHCQFTEKIRKELRGGIIIYCNRGSEVYGFNDTGETFPIFRHEATEFENHVMDEVAAEMQSILAEKSITSQIVSNRMNRRKIDLLPGWEVEKSEIGDALISVQNMLEKAGISGGIEWAADKLSSLARDKGLDDLRITSDVKHLEFGLTDKSDSVEYIMEKLLPERGLSLDDVIFIGDEFGEVGGFIGSDSLMMKPASTQGGLFISVGKEPNGVPDGVIHYRHGPEGFMEILDILQSNSNLD